MKPHFSLILIFLISANLYSQFSGGTGRAADPYLITSRADMEALADSVNNGDWWSQAKFFRVENDITDSVRTIIGHSVLSANGRHQFQGDFDGNGKKITLAISGANAGYYIGLFASVEMRNVSNLTVDGYVRYGGCVGGICGIAKSRVANCTSYCEIIGTNIAGGVCGYSTANELTNCANYGPVQAATGAVGGICANADSDSRIINCTNYGNITGRFCVGGICGNITSTIVSDCKNYGNVSSSDEYAGGICGAVVLYDSVHIVTDCRNYGDVASAHAAGGITGCIANQSAQADFSSLRRCANAGTVVADTAAGGITGHSHENTTISECLNIGTVRANEYVGGIASGFDNIFAPSNGHIYNCQNAGLVSGYSIVGGIIGKAGGNMGFTINTGVVMGATSLVGGIAGMPSFGFTEANEYFDGQMCTYSSHGNKPNTGWYEGRLTKNIVGDNLWGMLQSDYWTCDFYNASLYPVLKHFEKDSIGIVARAPVYLDTANGKDFDTHRKVRTNFKVNLENNVKWDRINGNVDIVNADGILVNDGEDTLVCSLGHIKKLVPINIIMPPIGDISFTIWATDHKLVVPSNRNYRIPIYIKADANTPREITIEKLIVEIDESVFYAKRSDNGTLANKTLSGNIIEITVEDITIPVLNANEDVVLFNLIGDMLLGAGDSSGINLNKPIEFVGTLNSKVEQINGSITLDICREGNDRFIANPGKLPSLSIKNNPANDFLEVECNIVGSGEYLLEVVDITGRVVKVREFVSRGKENQFYFTFSTNNLASGNYLLVLTTNAGQQVVRFVVGR